MCTKLIADSTESGPNTPGLPNEQVGYMAYEGNGPSSAPLYKPLHSDHSQPHVESPLRKASFPVDAETGYGLEKKQSHTSSRFSSENALESETEDDEGELSLPTARSGKHYENGFDRLREDFGRYGDNSENGGDYDVPILASDEVARTPVTDQQPAVSPSLSRRGSIFYAGVDSDNYPGGHRSGSRSGSTSNSRPTSRPGSVHGMPGLSRFSTHDEDRENMHTPLEDVDEYEPLFPDEDGNKVRRPLPAVERLKLREQMKRFPSKDIWEDTPDSLQLQASVETPEPADEQPDPILKAPSAVFETPEQESARKGEVGEDEKAKLIPREERLAKSRFTPHLREEMSSRPGLGQRFPSRDIWEDSPDSACLETTVGAMPSNDSRSPPDEGLEAGAVVRTSRAPIEGIISGGQSRDNATAGAPAMKPSVPPRPTRSKLSPPTDMGMEAPPSVPARPPRRLYQVSPADAQVPMAPSKLSATSPTEGKQPSPTEARKGPLLPERKPQIPARPTKPVGREFSETIPLSKIASASSIGSDGSPERDFQAPPAPKPKPAVPARPAGGKIASLKAGFLSDLDSRLKIGPQAPKPQEKEPEIEEDKAPLADARKGRAKGPTRRKPVATTPDTSVAGSSTEPQEGKPPVRDWSIQAPWMVFEHDGALKVGHPALTVVPAALSTTLENVDKPADEAENAPISKAMTLGDMTSITQNPISKAQNDGTAEDAKDMRQAQQAVQESLTASNPLSQDKVASPPADIPRPAEELSNPLSKEPSPASSAASTAISPTTTNAQSQTGNKDITVNPDTEDEEKMTAIVGREAQRAEHGNDPIV